uniref:ATP synthase subunit a n=1 Tax=Pyemotes zhonghuajia TaxID=2749944 RepID=A0A8T9JCX8_9ACAR|nr:ATP synthase F0 subunit 6 [Pyemotes zhonghuajia]UOK09672.1 ATP synthase F0 subunit 6 [Pyemotes zhonghuajia]
MMTNLFSMFDPSNFLFSSIWFMILFIFLNPLILNNSFSTMKNIILKTIFKEFLNNNPNSIISFNMSIIFFMIIMLNLFAMLPFSFTFTAQVNLIFPFSLTLWLTINLFSIFNKTNNFFSHLLPLGSPTILMPILILIELISNLIRPITLSVRLIANLIAGHLLIHLLSSFSLYLSNMFFLIIPFSMILYILELAVCFIQGYIFTILISLYANEMN